MKLIVCLLLLLPSLAVAAVYKCVDNGQVTYSATPCGDNAQRLSGQIGDQPQQEQQGAILTLYLRADHSFRVPGTINNHSAEFVVDTGSSSTVLSQRMASAAGIKTCTNLGYSSTANGVVRSCVAEVSELSFGEFHLTNLMVTILPNLNVDGLLGMDVLRRMKVEQHGDVMYISN